MISASGSKPLLVCDFDGVLVDGMSEYWWAAREAALQLDASLPLPEAIPEAFRRLRPAIHKGWEMVLVAAEIAWALRHGPTGTLIAAASYEAALEPALERRGWSAQALQTRLEAVRSQALSDDRAGWLARHRFFPGVPERLQRLPAEGVDWGVLTTKGAVYAGEILAAAGLQPLFLHGHEQGSKTSVLLQLKALQRPLWFLEDRRPTLEAVRRTPGLEVVRCFLVSWGYLAAGDDHDLARLGLHWLTPTDFGRPLADWP
ncbi:MAG: HAD family hydrolase [Cyanobium sp.]